MLNQPHYVVLHRGVGPLAESPATLNPIALTSRFDLTDDIWIERLSLELGTLVINSCDPRHNHFHSPLHEEHLYAFVRRVPLAEKSMHEGMMDLQAAIALSRLVHPTSTGLRYCAWVSNLTAEDPTIMAVTYKGACPDVMLAPDARDWLTEADGLEVRRLMSWLKTDMHTAVHRAYWNLEYAMHVRELDMRWVYVVSGFEALINTDRDAATSQFKHRVSQLANELGVSLSKNELSKAYDIRSKLIHAEAFLHGLCDVVPHVKQNALYQKLEDLLRLAVKRCLLDSAFGNHFKDYPSVNARWPMPDAPRRGIMSRVARTVCEIVRRWVA